MIVMIFITMEEETGNFFDGFSEEDYYKPILLKSSFKGNYKYYDSRGIKKKDYQ